MKFLVSVIDDKSTAATPVDPAASGAVDDYNKRLQADGYLVFVGALGSPGTATVVDSRDGEAAMFTDGPFVESKEYLGGLWIIEAPDRDVALRLAADGSKHCHRRVEVRPFQTE